MGNANGGAARSDALVLFGVTGDLAHKMIFPALYAMAKELEVKGWGYPKHMTGRVFSVVVHGDAAGVESLRRILTDWLTDMGLIPAGQSALVGSYLGYYEPYATSHDDLDQEKDFHEEVRNAARSLVQALRLLRRGDLKLPDASLTDPRQK